MKIFIDLIHPANIHYFKYFIKAMIDNGHNITVSARDKDVLQKLLKAYNLPYINMGKGSIGKGALGKALYLLYATIILFVVFIINRPKIVLSFGSTPCAISAFILRIPHVAFEDTEHARLNRKLYAPLTSLICTPSSFYEDIGKSHFRFNGYMELFYLHKKRFNPNPDILEEMGLKLNEPFAFIRFVSWGAFHDIGQKRLSDEQKIMLIRELKKHIKVFISSEGMLPADLRSDEIKLSPEKVHDVLYYSTFYLGEGGTMASECAMLGVPSIYINSLPLMGYLKDEQDAGLLFYLHDYDEILQKSVELTTANKSDFKLLKEKFLSDKIDPTAFLVWLIENYPASKKKVLSNATIQNQFS